jgi:enamine deaminase RidA (YjgF/YER057c/UK114 family)
MRIEKRLAELGIVLPALPELAGLYGQGVLAGDLLFLSGKVPKTPDGTVFESRVGVDVTAEEARKAARRIGLLLLAAMRTELGDLDRVRRIVKVSGFVCAAPDFTDHAAVIDGCSEVFIEVFGEAGRHARSSIGVASLPGGGAVEAEAVVQVHAREPSVR